MSKAKNEAKEIEVRGKEKIARGEGEPTRAGTYYSPQVDIYENEDAITLIADLPGVDRDRLDVNLEDDVLTITGFAKQPEARLSPVYSEFDVGGYTRRFTLGDAIDQAAIGATLKDGVLSLVLPKADRLKPRKIAIQTA